MKNRLTGSVCSEDLVNLRQRAEKKLSVSETVNPELSSPEAIQKLYHELQVQQIELEIQNEELRLALAELEASQTRYFELYDLAPIGYLTLTATRLIKESNLAAASMFGVTRNSLVKEPISRILPDNDQLIFSRQLNQCRDSGLPQDWDMQLVRADGFVFWAHLKAELAKCGEYWITINDITGRKQGEEQLNRNEARLKVLVKILQHQSDTIQEFLDYALEQAIQLTGSKIGYIYNYNESNMEFVLNSWSREVMTECAVVKPHTCYELDKTGIWGEAVRQRKPIIINGYPAANTLKKGYPVGHVQLMNFMTVPIFKNSEIVGVVGLANKETAYDSIDILEISLLMEAVWKVTENKQSEENNIKLTDQLQQTRKIEAIGRLAGGVAHDFNNMLGVIMGYTEMALMKLDPSQPLYADLEEVSKAAERSAALTRQLLAFARKQTIEPKVLDLNLFIAAMLKMLQRLIGENIELSWQPGAALWQVLADPSQIDQMLANLCVNVRDAITDVGKATIETGNSVLDEGWCATHLGSVPGEYVLIRIRDNGSGMDKEVLEHLFEPFFTTKETGKGTGMGLATVYGVVKQNNGFLTVDSQPGEGTTFSIYLPRYLGNKGKIQVKSATIPADLNKETILLVEDEAKMLKMARIVLEMHGYTVLSANSPGKAFSLAREYGGEVDLLLTDVIMPEMNGRDLMGKLLSLYPALKSLFMSGYTADVICDHGVLENGIFFIQKPFSLEGLTAKVREALDRT
mgnify:CR=1 FL=1